jgi:hypothetical protein
VPGEGHRPPWERVIHGVPGDERRQEHRYLAGPGRGELVGVGVEQQAGERATGGRLGLANDLPGGMIDPRLPGAWQCGTLTRKDHGVGHEGMASSGGLGNGNVVF